MTGARSCWKLSPRRSRASSIHASLLCIAVFHLSGDRAEPISAAKKAITVLLGGVNLLLSFLVLAGGVALGILTGSFNGETLGVFQISSAPSFGIVVNCASFAAIIYFSL